ncbi:MAG: hypothetical protein JXB32_17770 [Deltaproteobacteria bacterium]|nr:hypothetical protein [Deltaproteobacteria bacterium]
MRKLLAVLLVLGSAVAPAARADELSIAGTLGGTAPLTEVLRRAQPGFAFGLEFVYGPTPWFEFGARYALGVFPQEERDEWGRVKETLLDHGVGGVLRFTLAGGPDAGWLNEPGTMRSSFWLELGGGYHSIGREHCGGFDAGLGWELRPLRSLFFAPLVRFTSVFDTTQGVASYVVLALAIGYDFGRLLRRAGADEEDEADAARQQQPAYPPPPYPPQPRAPYPDALPGGG